MAREAGDIARSLNQEPILISASPEALSNSGYEVICEEALGSYTDINFVIGIADARTRRLIHQRYMHKLKFVNLIHPMASFGFGQKEIIKKHRPLLKKAKTVVQVWPYVKKLKI